MKTTEASNLLAELERAIDVESLRVGDFCGWPLARLAIWDHLVTPSGYQSHSWFRNLSRINLSTLVNLVVDTVPRVLPNALRTVGVRQLDNCEVVFIGRPSHLQQIASHRTPVDRVLDPIADVAGQSWKVRSFLIGVQARRDSGKSRLRVTGTGPSPIVTGLYESGLADEMCRFQLPIGVLTHQLKRYSKLFWRGYHSWRRMLAHAGDLQAVFVSVWYSPEMMGIIAASNQFGIRTVDVQHGHDESNGMGAWEMVKAPTNGYEIVPSMFWTWRQRIHKSSTSNVDRSQIHQTVCGGYPWVYFWRDNCSHQLQVGAPAFGSSQIRVLFVIRSPYGTSTERIPDFVLEFLSQAHPEIEFNFRLHPNDPDGRTYVKKRLSGRLATRYRISPSTEDLYESVSNSTHVLSPFSAVVLEARTLGVPVLTYGEDARENESSLIAAKQVQWTEGRAADIESFLYSSDKPEPFMGLESSREKTKTTLDVILAPNTEP